MTHKNRFLAAVLTLVLVLGLFAGCGSSEPAETTPATEKPANPAYTQIFLDRGIAHVDAPAFMCEAASFAMVMEGQGVDVLAYTYKDDVVLSLRESVYISVEGLDEAGLDGMKQYVESTVQEINATGLAEADWGEGPTHYRLTVYMKDLDDMNNARALVDAGLMSLDNPDLKFISMDATRSALTASGYIER